MACALSPTGLIPWFSKAEGNTYSTLLHHPFLFKGKTNASSRGSRKDFWRRCRGDLCQAKTYQVPIINSHSSHYIIRHSPLIFLSHTSKMIFEICLFFALLRSSSSLAFCVLVCLNAHLALIASPPIIVSTPDNEVLNLNQREVENLKDAWYRICNAQNRSTRKQSTFVLLRIFYVGITP